MSSLIFLIQCPDQKGLVARVSGFFYERNFNILHCQQYTDLAQKRFYMRLKLDLHEGAPNKKVLTTAFEAFSAPYRMTWTAHYSDVTPRAAILVSRQSHCLYDLILRKQEGELRVDFAVVLSNHPDLKDTAESFGIPFHHVPNQLALAEREAAIQTLLQQYKIDFMILARYMQILSGPFVDAYQGKIINIHHAFLPAFQGANTYQRAYDHGVKMIGATAHYATAELDAGPIIEQDVERVTHEDTPETLRAIGRDIERIVLARAVKAHLESRVMISGTRTIVFSTGV